MVATYAATAHARKVKEDANDNAHKSPVPIKKEPDGTPPDTDVALPVSTAMNPITATDA